jgi:hypothetical protein
MYIYMMVTLEVDDTTDVQHMADKVQSVLDAELISLAEVTIEVEHVE